MSDPPHVIQCTGVTGLLLGNITGGLTQFTYLLSYRQINLITLFLLFSFSQPSYYLGGFKGISPLGGIVPLLSVNLLALHHVLYVLGIQLGFPNSSQLRWVMGLHWCPTKLERRKQFRDKFLQCFFYISTSEDSRSHVGCWRWLQHCIQLWKAVKNRPNL